MDKQRYARQLSLDKIGEKGQKALLNAHVTIIGCGGLGSIAATYLAAAGVGNLTLIDGDQAHVSNLHRQVFFKEKSTGQSKAEELAEHIGKLNSDVELGLVSEMLSKENIAGHLAKAELVLECTDDILTKYLVNDHCHQKQIPLVYGAIHKYEGVVSFFRNENEQSIHLRDIYPEPDTSIPTCSEVGVLNTIAGLIGLFQANEAIKSITGCGPVLEGKFLTYDALNNEQSTIKLKKTYTSNEEDEGVMDREGNTVSFAQIPSITIDEIQEHLHEYRVVSLLEEQEFVAIAENVEQVPYSEFYWFDWHDDGRPTVFYCSTGARSAEVVYDLMHDHPKAKLAYLKNSLPEILEKIKA